MNDLKMEKFEKLIRDIDDIITPDTARSMYKGRSLSIRQPAGLFSFLNDSLDSQGEEKRSVNSLYLIFDYDKCNKYAKTIMEGTYYFWANKYCKNDLKKNDILQGATKSFITFCRSVNDQNCVFEQYRFIFWTLMILTVDKTNADEYLTLICDFARLIGLSDDEFEDIVEVIKIVYGQMAPGYRYKSQKTKDFYSNRGYLLSGLAVGKGLV